MIITSQNIKKVNLTKTVILINLVVTKFIMKLISNSFLLENKEFLIQIMGWMNQK